MSDRDEPRATVTPLAFAANLAKSFSLPNEALQEAWTNILLRLEKVAVQRDLEIHGSYAVGWLAALKQAKVIDLETQTALFIARDRVYSQAQQRLQGGQ